MADPSLPHPPGFLERQAQACSLWAHQHPQTAVLLFFLFTRMLVLGAAWMGGTHVTDSHSHVWEDAEEVARMGGIPPWWMEPFIRFDASYYIPLAREGYPAFHPPPVFETAFFPLFPLLTRVLALLIPDAMLAAMLVCLILGLGAALLMERALGLLPAVFFLASPASHFLTAPYSEATFAFFFAGALVAMKHGRLGWAGVCGALASASRAPGLVVAGMLMVYTWNHRRETRTAARAFLSAGLACGGLVAYAIFCWDRYGDPLAFSHVQSAWNRSISLLGPIKAFLAFEIDPDYYLLSFVALWLLWRMRVQYRDPAFWAAAFLLFLPLSTGTLTSIIRFQGVNLPLFGQMGSEFRGRRAWAVILIGLVWMFYEMERFAAGHSNN